MADHISKRLLDYKRRLGQLVLHSPLHPLLISMGALRHAEREYQEWVAREQASVPSRQWFLERCRRFQSQPVCSILMPTYNPKREWLEAAIASVRQQTYPSWELCICDDCSNEPWVRPYLEEAAQRDPRVQIQIAGKRLGISGALNQAARQASGEYLAFLDHDDVLAPYALHYVVEALQGSDADIVYSDEDKLDRSGRRVEPIFKPAWSPDLLLGCMYLGHFLVVKRWRFEEVGGFRSSTDGSQDHDLVLRVTDHPAVVRHVPVILYHWRKHAASTAATPASKPFTDAAALTALEETLRRRNIDATAEQGQRPHAYRVRHSGAGAGRASLVLCSRSEERLRRILPMFASSTAGRDCEIIVVQHGYHAAGDGYRHIPAGGEYNLSRMCNLGAAAAAGEWLVFLDDQEWPSDNNWLDELAGHVARAGVGIVGGRLSLPSGAIQHAGIVTGIMEGFGYLLRGQYGSRYWHWHDLTRDVSAVSRAVMAIRKTVFIELGGFDEALPGDFAGVDLCCRARARGYAVIYEPAAVLVREDHPAASVTAKDTLQWRQKWPQLADTCDAFYNPHLSTRGEDASLGEGDPFFAGDPSRTSQAVAMDLRSPGSTCP